MKNIFNVATIPLSQLIKLIAFYYHLIPTPYWNFFNWLKNVFFIVCLFGKRSEQGLSKYTLFY